MAEPSAGDAELAGAIDSGSKALGVPLSAAQVQALVTFLRLIERWNGSYNLTAIRDPRQMVVQHVLDCVAAGAALSRRRPKVARLLDVGSGAGLPGIVLGLLFPHTDVVCVDSVMKKVAFITQAAATLRLDNVRGQHARVETLHAATFDVITSRAFASLSEFVIATRHLIESGGCWMALKGKVPTNELQDFDVTAFHVEQLLVPGLQADRCIVWIEAGQLVSVRKLPDHIAPRSTNN